MGVSIVVVGASLGGLAALKILLAGLPDKLRTPIVIVQHRGKDTDDALVNALRREIRRPISEPDDKAVLEPGHVYLAPADYHLLVEPGSLALSTDAPVNHSRPAVDVLFESAAEAYGSGVVGVVLTGSSRDGAAGCARIKERGGVVLVQDAESAESGVMPRAAIAATRVDRVLLLHELPAALCELCLEAEHG